MIQKIPLSAVPSQKFLIVLDRQSFYFHVYQRLNRVFMTLLVDNVEVFGGILCRDRLPLKQSRTYTFRGNLAFRDAEGRADPAYTGFGGRHELLYFGEGDGIPDTYQTPIIDQDFPLTGN